MCVCVWGQFQIQTLTQNHLNTGPANLESLLNPKIGNSFFKMFHSILSFECMNVRMRMCLPWGMCGEQRTM